MPQAVSDREAARVGSLVAASWQTRGKKDAGQKRQRIWGRGGDKPDAGEKSGKNAVFDRPAPNCRHQRASSLAQERRQKMSKKVLGFTSRKWVAFWWGLICGVVIGGLAVS